MIRDKDGERVLQSMTGSFDDLLAFQARKFPDALIEMERTPELWVKRKTKEA